MAEKSKNESKAAKPKAKPAPSSGKSDASQKTIVRVKGADIVSTKTLGKALMGIHGVSYNLAGAIVHVSGLDPKMTVDNLTEKDIDKIEAIIDDPVKHGVPGWYVNRRNDYVTGEDKHLSGSDIRLTLRDDVNRLRKIRAYRGIRHELGLPLRGQRTKSSFRKSGVATRKKK